MVFLGQYHIASNFLGLNIVFVLFCVELILMKAFSNVMCTKMVAQIENMCKTNETWPFHLKGSLSLN